MKTNALLGEIYGLVDYMSEENSDFSSLLSVFMTVLTEDDISKLTPYAKELELLGKFSNIAGLVDLSYDILNWDSPENYKQRISIFMQNARGASYNYDLFVNDDLCFKEYASGFTGTVIKPEDDYVTVIKTEEKQE